MAFEEKRAWIMGLVTVGVYVAYVLIILGRAQHMPLTQVPYIATLLWTVAASVAATTLLQVVASATSPKKAQRRDQRDSEIHRFGEYTGQAFVIIGSVAAMGMAMAELNHFWIANTIYLAFVLSSILGSVAKIVAYRWGFGPR